MKQLAIIIPAYKATFLRSALESIANQTCKDFNLYIGDDCSPYPLSDIVDEFRDKVNLVYERFDTNVGGNDLVAQWERCIAMSQGEPYIWLFSDDDIMEAGCVESFLSLPDNVKNNYIVHYNIRQIDEAGNTKMTPPLFPKTLTAKEYLDKKLFSPFLNSFVVEFVFPRWIYENNGGFQKYDLAWGSDFVTWIKFADACKGIYTIENKDSMIMWRSSNENISPDKSHPIFMRKILSQINYTSDIVVFLKKHKYPVPFKYVRFIWGYLSRNIQYYNKKDLEVIKTHYIEKIGFSFISYIAYCVVKIKLSFLKPLYKK